VGGGGVTILVPAEARRELSKSLSGFSAAFTVNGAGEVSC